MSGKLDGADAALFELTTNDQRSADAGYRHWTVIVFSHSQLPDFVCIPKMWTTLGDRSAFTSISFNAEEGDEVTRAAVADFEKAYMLGLSKKGDRNRRSRRPPSLRSTSPDGHGRAPRMVHPVGRNSSCLRPRRLLAGGGPAGDVARSWRTPARTAGACLSCRNADSRRARDGTGPPASAPHRPARRRPCRRGGRLLRRLHCLRRPHVRPDRTPRPRDGANAVRHPAPLRFSESCSVGRSWVGSRALGWAVVWRIFATAPRSRARRAADGGTPDPAVSKWIRVPEDNTFGARSLSPGFTGGGSRDRKNGTRFLDGHSGCFRLSFSRHDFPAIGEHQPSSMQPSLRERADSSLRPPGVSSKPDRDGRDISTKAG